MNITMHIKAAFTAAGALCGMFIGGFGGFALALAAFMLMDYITGVLAAVKEKRLSSEIGFWGLIRKLSILSMVAIGSFIDVFIIKHGSVVRDMVIFFYMSNEGISILENLSVLGVEYPEKLKSVLLQLKEKEANKNDTNN